MGQAGQVRGTRGRYFPVASFNGKIQIMPKAVRRVQKKDESWLDETLNRVSTHDRQPVRRNVGLRLHPTQERLGRLSDAQEAVQALAEDLWEAAYQEKKEKIRPLNARSSHNTDEYKVPTKAEKAKILAVSTGMS